MQSKITGGPTELLFTGKILNKYDVKYHKCVETGFIQTEEPFWLEEAYSSAITKLDVGLASRNEILRETIIPIINKHFDSNAKFLDYAGGYGLFTRIMRDKGYDFYHTDVYCKNIFAEFFDLVDAPTNTKFELVTAFEVFEHLSDPIAELEIIGKLADNILFSTVLQPKTSLKSFEDWWYFIPETGQHIALHTEESLAYLAEKLGYKFYTDGLGVHLFTRAQLLSNPFKKKQLPYLIATMKRKVERYFRKQSPSRETLLQKDWQLVKDTLK